MNGLKIIRKQCNVSQSGLADAIGVTRQMINAWENGAKAIPEARKKQLGEFFGLDSLYFGPITEEQKKELLDKPLFLDSASDASTYRYVPADDGRKHMAHFMPEREQTLNDEYLDKMQEEKSLMNRIELAIMGAHQRSKMDQIMILNRGLETFETFLNAYNGCFDKPIIEKMIYWKTLRLVECALEEAITGNTDKESMSDDEVAWINNLAEMIEMKANESIPSKANYSLKVDMNTTESFEKRINAAQKMYQQETLDGDIPFSVLV